jgi:hypothetical protein
MASGGEKKFRTIEKCPKDVFGGGSPLGCEKRCGWFTAP